MRPNDSVLICYVWLVRINGCVRRGRQPLLRGREWFFNVRVQPGFYTGGRSCVAPFAFDIPLAVAIFMSARLQLLTWLILG